MKHLWIERIYFFICLKKKLCWNEQFYWTWCRNILTVLQVVSLNRRVSSVSILSYWWCLSEPEELLGAAVYIQQRQPPSKSCCSVDVTGSVRCSFESLYTKGLCFSFWLMLFNDWLFTDYYSAWLVNWKKAKIFYSRTCFTERLI